MSLKSSFITFLNQKYPEISLSDLENQVSDQLISSCQVPLSAETIADIQNQIKQFWQLRQWGVENLNFESYGLRKPNNFSACMSYDFHLTTENKLELIEVNTNAAFLAMGLELYQFLKLKNPAGPFSEIDLIKMFDQELALLGKTEKSIAVVDENPSEQRLYVEFLIYKSLFKKHGYKVDIIDIKDSEKLKNYSLIYNRYTDFYLQEDKSKTLRSLYNENKIQLSPNPYEYFLLADKNRFLDWTEQTVYEKPNSLLATYDLGKEDKEKIWSERKNLFFKPKTSFGSKQAYRGASISRKTFDEIANANFIGQKFSFPSEVEVLLDPTPQKMKFDLRCYAYQDQLQLIIARLYQGQTTNLRTTGGGFACVVTK